MDWQVGFQGKRICWTNQTQKHQFRDHEVRNPTDGPRWKQGISNITKKGMLALRISNLEGHSKQSYKERQLEKIDSELTLPLVSSLSHAMPCNNKMND